MFRKIIEPLEPLTFSFDGRTCTAARGDSVAAALLRAGVQAFRTTLPGCAPRGPYCLMGACFECLVTIDGVGNRQSCLIDLAEGMVVQSQHGHRDLAGEVPE